MTIPVFTIAVALASLLASILPELSSLLIFDHNALVRGEIWRILTCHFVHFSTPHLTYNLLVFIVSGYIIEKNNYRQFGWLLFWLASAISISLFVLKPNMVYYGGLSGVACGSLYYWALRGIKNGRPWQSICQLIVLFVPVKIAIEIYNSASVLPYWEQQFFVPMHTSHIVGCTVAILFYLFKMKGTRSSIPALPDAENVCGLAGKDVRLERMTSS